MKKVNALVHRPAKIHLNKSKNTHLENNLKIKLPNKCNRNQLILSLLIIMKTLKKRYIQKNKLNKK